MLLINRNAAILCDSDKTQETDLLESRVVRIQAEFASLGNFAWITDGRTVENYLPSELIEQWLIDRTRTTKPTAMGPFESCKEYLKSNGRKTFDKVEFAQELSPQLTKSHLIPLQPQLDRLCEEIRKWNGLE